MSLLGKITYLAGLVVLKERKKANFRLLVYSLQNLLQVQKLIIEKNFCKEKNKQTLSLPLPRFTVSSKTLETAFPVSSRLTSSFTVYVECVDVV